MNYTQAQIDRANAVSLEDFLRTQGETLIKSGREYRWKEHDSLTVRGNKWFRHSQSKGGYPIDSYPFHNNDRYGIHYWQKTEYGANRNSRNFL